MSGQPRALLFTEFCRKVSELETKGMDMVEAHDIIMRGAVKKHAGVVVSSADALWQAVFDSPLKALATALAVQRRLCERNRESPPEKKVSAKMCLHEGVFTSDEKGVYGIETDVLYRLIEATPCGRVFATGKVYAKALGKHPCAFIPLGREHFTGIHEAVEVFEIVPALGLGSAPQ
ncbi:MAG TPA: hypothetical protein DCM05_04745 [Elusimicrobia bacterium]|nr:hypothetical protein [Elusimicrobiota bacterium]